MHASTVQVCSMVALCLCGIHEFYTPGRPSGQLDVYSGLPWLHQVDCVGLL